MSKKLNSLHCPQKRIMVVLSDFHCFGARPLASCGFFWKYDELSDSTFLPPIDRAFVNNILFNKTVMFLKNSLPF